MMVVFPLLEVAFLAFIMFAIVMVIAAVCKKVIPKKSTELGGYSGIKGMTGTTGITPGQVDPDFLPPNRNGRSYPRSTVTRITERPHPTPGWPPPAQAYSKLGQEAEMLVDQYQKLMKEMETTRSMIVGEYGEKLKSPAKPVRKEKKDRYTILKKKD